jgi:CRP-like cAMP-binding protein
MLDVLARYESTLKIDVPAGTELLREGVRSGKLYVLAEGTLEVLRGETRVALVSEPGAIFGEMSVLLDQPHTATMRAFVPSSVYEFHDAAAFLRGDSETALVVARLLAQRLNAATTYLVDLTRQFEGHGNHLSMVGDVLASLLHHQEAEFTPGSDRQPDPEM